MPKTANLFCPFEVSLRGNIASCARRKLPMVEWGVHRDAPGFVVCGTGPTLMETDSLMRITALIDAGWIVFALKEAVTLLRDRGYPVHYSAAMDPGWLQLRKTPIDPSVTYCLASGCHPCMFEWVLGHGAKALVYHSVNGVDHELQRYMAMFDKNADTVAGGFTVVNRAAALANYMGAGKPPIAIAGASFGWREDGGYYAPGVTGRAGNEGAVWDDKGKLDGRLWLTKMDMLPSAAAIANGVRTGKVEIIGDSLAAALAAYPEEFVRERVIQ